MSADLSNPSTLPTAFAGATAIFSTTDFWAPFYDPSTESLLKDGKTLAEYCKELESQQAMNVADAASMVLGLERLVVSALCHAERASGGKYGNVKHWDGKAEGVMYLKEKYPELAERTTVVVVGNYMENWLTDIKLRKVRYSMFSTFPGLETDNFIRNRPMMVPTASPWSDQDLLVNHTSASPTTSAA